jgi:16S rRNA (adenine1518-N6/adenine1519-N6)-dimethyltransferase
MMLTPATVQALLDEHRIHPKKSLGQNFLADPNTARRIVTLAEVGEGDLVVEIGPGLGSLTLALLDAGADVLAVELDATLATVLRSVVAGADASGGIAGTRRGRAEVHVADALTVDWPALLAGRGPWACVSNLPYNVAVPVVVRVLETAPAVDRLLVMVQREVGERLAAAPGDDAYGAVSVKIAYHAEAAVAGVVAPTVFVPRPKVDSVLVGMRRRAAPPVTVPSEDALFTLVRAGFAQRRKMLRRSLAPVLGARAEAVLTGAGVEPTARAEVLGLEEWAAVARSAAAA